MATTYPWNGRAATREVIIEKSMPAPVSRRDVVQMEKMLDCKLRAIKHSVDCSKKQIMKQNACNEKKLMRRIKQAELLEILRRRGDGGRDRRLEELVLLGGEDGGIGGGEDSTLLAALLLEEGGRRHHGGHHGGNIGELEMMQLRAKLNKLENNMVQVDTVLGIRPIVQNATQA